MKDAGKALNPNKSFWKNYFNALKNRTRSEVFSFKKYLEDHLIDRSFEKKREETSS